MEPDELVDTFARERGRPTTVFRDVTLRRSHAATKAAAEMLDVLRRDSSAYFDGAVVFDDCELEFYEDPTGALGSLRRIVSPYSFEGWTDFDRHILLRREIVVINSFRADAERAAASGLIVRARGQDVELAALGPIDELIGSWLSFAEVVFTNAPPARFHRPRGPGARTPDRERLADLYTFALTYGTASPLALWLPAMKIALREPGWIELAETSGALEGGSVLDLDRLARGLRANKQ